LLFLPASALPFLALVSGSESGEAIRRAPENLPYALWVFKQSPAANGGHRIGTTFARYEDRASWYGPRGL
jgi:hypothetical protein